MINDEMRELLSAYVDGELRDSDSARVEDLSKRDPELRREIDAYRKLRAKLKDWDEAEHGLKPEPTLKRRALARARTLVNDRTVQSRGRIVSFLFNPITVAAATLLVAGTGLLAARRAERPVLDVAIEKDGGSHGVKVAPPLRYADVRIEGSALVEYVSPAPDSNPRGHIWDHMLSRRAFELREMMIRDEQRGRRLRERRIAHPESRTGTRRNLEVMAMIRGYAATGEPWDGLVLVNHPKVDEGLPAVGAVPTGVRLGIDHHIEKSIMFDLSKSNLKDAVLTPLGEVWRATKDGTGRTRVVTIAHWGRARQSELVPIVWADEIAAPKNRSNLEAQPFILGPKARRRLLGARRGKDAEFLAWLRREYGGRDLAALFAKDANKRAVTVDKLVRALGKDGSATGFAVVDGKGRLLGIELFANHELMLAFAPRLLHGYLFEAGDEGVALTKPAAAQGPATALVTLELEGLTSRALKLEAVDGYGRAKDKRRVNIMGPAATIIGHGLLTAKNRPIHVTLFGE